jgi:polysaccharide pyruvyl transferase WcaK-like protein
MFHLFVFKKAEYWAKNYYDRIMKTALSGRKNNQYNALAASFIKLVADIRPDAKIHLLYGNRSGGVQQFKLSDKTVELDIVNFRLSPKARLNEHLFWILLLALLQRIIPFKSVRNKLIQSNRWLRTLLDADFVGEICGGDSFTGIYGMRLFLLGAIPCIIAILMRKNLVLLPQTYGPYNSAVAKHIARLIMMRAERLYCRDRDSVEVIRSLLGEKADGKDVRFCPDVAFVLESALPEKPNIQPALERKKNVPLIGLNVSSLLYIGGFTRDDMFGLKVDYKEFIDTLLKHLMEQTNASVLLVPHQLLKEEPDACELSICRRLFESIGDKYGGRIYLVNQEYNQSESKGIIGLCDFFIGSRMHACIAALSQCIPAVGLAYSKKFKGVFQSVGADDFVIDMRQKRTDEIIEAITDAYEHRIAVTENLRRIVPVIQTQVLETFRDILLEKNLKAGIGFHGHIRPGWQGMVQ